MIIDEINLLKKVYSGENGSCKAAITFQKLLVGIISSMCFGANHTFSR
jgi:hypothetical protein